MWPGVITESYNRCEVGGKRGEAGDCCLCPPLLSWQALQVDWLIVLSNTESKADSLAPAFTDPGLGESSELDREDILDTLIEYNNTIHYNTIH